MNKAQMVFLSSVMLFAAMAWFFSVRDDYPYLDQAHKLKTLTGWVLLLAVAAVAVEVAVVFVALGD